MNACAAALASGVPKALVVLCVAPMGKDDMGLQGFDQMGTPEAQMSCERFRLSVSIRPFLMHGGGLSDVYLLRVLAARQKNFLLWCLTRNIQLRKIVITYFLLVAT